ncbi:hypothetical protein FRC10_011541 [Ceratobasidium sp. 414]|nr:hypothetical protein FRC10_011541 [Ceratobasidium sp. 414]
MSTTPSADDSLRGFDHLNGLNYPTWEYTATLNLMVHDQWDLFDASNPASVPPPAFVSSPPTSTTSTAPTSALATTASPSTPTTAPGVAATPQPASAPAPNPDYAAWRKCAIKATTRLIKLINTAHMHLIMVCETPLKQWQNLADVFSKHTTQAILNKRTKLSQMRWDTNGTEPLQAFLQSMVALGTELAHTNHPVSAIDMCGFIGMAMPDGLQQSVSMFKRIGSLVPKSWVHNLVEDEKAFKLHKPSTVTRVSRIDTSDCRGGRPRGECWKCHDRGHIQKDCLTISEEERRALRRQHEEHQRAHENSRVAMLEGRLSTIRARGAAMAVFKGTLHVPGIVGTFISVQQLCGSSGGTVKVLFFDDCCEVWGANQLEFRCNLVDELYVLERVSPPPMSRPIRT